MSYTLRQPFNLLLALLLFCATSHAQSVPLTALDSGAVWQDAQYYRGEWAQLLSYERPAATYLVRGDAALRIADTVYQHLFVHNDTLYAASQEQRLDARTAMLPQLDLSRGLNGAPRTVQLPTPRFFQPHEALPGSRTATPRLLGIKAQLGASDRHARQGIHNAPQQGEAQSLHRQLLGAPYESSDRLLDAVAARAYGLHKHMLVLQPNHQINWTSLPHEHDLVTLDTAGNIVQRTTTFLRGRARVAAHTQSGVAVVLSNKDALWLTPGGTEDYVHDLPSGLHVLDAVALSADTLAVLAGEVVFGEEVYGVYCLTADGYWSKLYEVVGSDFSPTQLHRSALGNFRLVGTEAGRPVFAQADRLDRLGYLQRVASGTRMLTATSYPYPDTAAQVATFQQSASRLGGGGGGADLAQLTTRGDLLLARGQQRFVIGPSNQFLRRATGDESLDRLRYVAPWQRRLSLTDSTLLFDTDQGRRVLYRTPANTQTITYRLLEAIGLPLGHVLFRQSISEYRGYTTYQYAVVDTLGIPVRSYGEQYGSATVSPHGLLIAGAQGFSTRFGPPSTRTGVVLDRRYALPIIDSFETGFTRCNDRDSIAYLDPLSGVWRRAAVPYGDVSVAIEGVVYPIEAELPASLAYDLSITAACGDAQPGLVEVQPRDASAIDRVHINAVAGAAVPVAGDSLAVIELVDTAGCVARDTVTVPSGAFDFAYRQELSGSTVVVTVSASDWPQSALVVTWSDGEIASRRRLPPGSIQVIEAHLVDFPACVQRDTLQVIGVSTAKGVESPLSLTVAPNPARSMVRLSAKLPVRGRLLDVWGRVVLRGEEFATQQTFAVGNLPAGWYVLEATDLTGRRQSTAILVE